MNKMLSIDYVPAYCMQKLLQDVSQFYQQLDPACLPNYFKKISLICRLLLGKAYLLHPLGEGLAGSFNQQPLYRLDGFDCVTFVNTVLSLAAAADVDGFVSNIKQLNYYGSVVSYVQRHHFMSVDWNVHNQALGWVKDITLDLGSDIVDYSDICVDKPTWYRKKSYVDIKRVEAVSQSDASQLLREFHGLADQVKKEQSCLAYLNINNLLQKKSWDMFFKRLPSICVIEIVRPGWDLREEIGTHLNVSHLGLSIRHENGIYFYHASQTAGQVVVGELFDYLLQYRVHPSVKGIHVMEVL